MNACLFSLQTKLGRYRPFNFWLCGSLLHFSNIWKPTKLCVNSCSARFSTKIGGIRSRTQEEQRDKGKCQKYIGKNKVSVQFLPKLYSEYIACFSQ